MNLLSEIIIHREKGDAAIQLLHGDLTAIPEEHKTDMVVISAFPGDYTPLPDTLIGAFGKKGLKVGDMAKTKEIDLTRQLGCWLSKPLSPKQQKLFNFKRILCFEPGRGALENETVVGNIFRCINTFAFDENNNDLAMPVVAGGNQKVPLSKMVPAILDAAVFWLESGLPLRSLKLVVYAEDSINAARRAFDRVRHARKKESLKVVTVDIPLKKKGGRLEKRMRGVAGSLPVADSFDVLASMQKGERSGKRRQALKRSMPDFESSDVLGALEETVPVKPEPAPPPPPKPAGYDYFISYAHTHADLIEAFVQAMKQKNDRLRIFYDKDSIPPGGLWIKQISEAITKAQKVLVFLSPDYDNSPVCWDEFQCAKVKEYNTRSSVIQTIYLYTYQDAMPLMMAIYSYLDCREGDAEKLKACVEKILA